jgi:hypothetical protein
MIIIAGLIWSPSNLAAWTPAAERGRFLKHRSMGTAKAQFRKFKTNISRKGTAWPKSQFLHSCFCERFIYSHDRSAYSAAGK